VPAHCRHSCISCSSARSAAALRQQDLFGNVRVADYLFAKDDLFARLILDDAEYGLYRQVHDRLAIDAPVPDLVIYLQAPVDVLQERIARRGIAHESLIDRGYLTRLNEPMRGSSMAMRPVRC
jgi:deoxyadenosine/deoxycytidine kinase